jgi:hypothetical protein
MVAGTPGLAAMDPAFLPHYVRIAARKLLFFHGKRSSLRGCKHKQVGTAGPGGRAVGSSGQRPQACMPLSM